MPAKSIFVLAVYVFLTYTIAHADPVETDLNGWYYNQKISQYHLSIIETPQKNAIIQQDTVAFQMSSLRNIPGVTAPNTLSTGGVSLCFHNNVGFETPFAGAFGYYRQPATFTYTGQPQTVNLGLLWTVEYMDSVWTKDVFGVKPKIDAKILLLSAMVGTDIQTPSGSLVAAGGLAFHATTLGVGVKLFGDGPGGGEYKGLTPTALIAHIFHTAPSAGTDGTLALYARYQDQGVVVGLTLGLISFD